MGESNQNVLKKNDDMSAKYGNGINENESTSFNKSMPPKSHNKLNLRLEKSIDNNRLLVEKKASTEEAIETHQTCYIELVNEMRKINDDHKKQKMNLYELRTQLETMVKTNREIVEKVTELEASVRDLQQESTKKISKLENAERHNEQMQLMVNSSANRKKSLEDYIQLTQKMVDEMERKNELLCKKKESMDESLKVLEQKKPDLVDKQINVRFQYEQLLTDV